MMGAASSCHRLGVRREDLAQDLIGDLDLLQQLKRKYGDTVEQVLEFAANGERELQHLENMEKEIELLVDWFEEYKKIMESCFGQDSVIPLHVRQPGFEFFEIYFS